VARGGSGQFNVAHSRGSIYVTGDHQQRLQLAADPFFDRLMKLPDDRSLDLLNIAAGVYTVDRIAKRNFASDELGIRDLTITFQVEDLDFWLQPEIQELIAVVLAEICDDNWRLQFEPTKFREAGGGHQRRLELKSSLDVKRVALFSGGLDSVAGLASRLVVGEPAYALVTVAHQSSLRRRTGNQIEALCRHLGVSTALHIPIVLGLRGGKAARLSMQEQSQRTRAFLFTACGAIAAKMLGVSKVELFENGVGAINLPPMMGMVFGALSTRGCQPIFLRRMSELCSAVMEEEICFELPFAKSTKAEVLRSLGEYDLATLTQSSQSCAHTSLRVPGKTHCGHCPACIERRQAFSIAGVRDDPSVYESDIFLNPPPEGPDAAYFRLYQDQAVSWLAGDPDSLLRLKTHLPKSAHTDERLAEIIALLDRHAKEVVDTYVRPLNSYADASLRFHQNAVAHGRRMQP
jgi:7-cyano-7-deazaguanine synthase in queuosine biosynthesis